jgi:hypothetical protein
MFVNPLAAGDSLHTAARLLDPQWDARGWFGEEEEGADEGLAEDIPAADAQWVRGWVDNLGFDPEQDDE